MTVFSEKVQPTFTSSDLNIIIVENYNEIFFDVFELEINGNKFVAEKVSEKDGKPIVSIPVKHNGQKKNVPFLLEKGKKTEIFYNESNSRLIRPIKETKIEKVDILNLVESKIQSKVPLFEVPDVEKAVDNIKAIKESAVEYLNKCRAEYVEAQKQEIASFENKKKQEIKKLNEEYRKNMVSEFLSLTENVKNQILESNSAERSNYNDYIRRLFVEYCQEIEDRVDNNYETAINSLESKVNSLTETIFADRIKRIFEDRVNEVEKIISANDTLTNKRLDEKITNINSRIDLKIDSSSKEITKNFESLVERYDKALRVLEESTIETNNNFVKNTNKALSRIGNVKTELSEKIDKINLDINTISKIQIGLRENIEVHKTNIKKYFNKKISLLDTKITDVNEEYKQEVVSLIRESERKLLEEIAGIDTKLPTLILKEARTKKDNVEVSLEDIRKELENNISGRFSKEIVSLKRLIEMTSGGGGAGGGGGSQSLSFNETTALLSISNGNTVSLSALSGGGSGGGGGITSETDPIFTTWAQANSGNYDLAYHTILTGGDVGGNLNLTGYLSTDSIRFNLGAGITPAIGELTWDATDETLYIGLKDEVTTRLSQDVLMRVKAAEIIKRGQAVYASGAAGDGSGNIQASLFSAVSGGIDELYTIGIAAEDLAVNEFGFISTFGKIRNISVANTRASDDPEYSLAANAGWAIGTILYPSAVEAGKLTQTPPQAPNRDIPLAMIISTNGNQRAFFVRYEHGYELDDLHDVRTVGVKAEGDILTWNNSVSAWENRAQTDPIFTTWAQANSAKYESAYTTVSSSSANWNYQGADIKALTANWQNTYTTVNTNTARYDSVYTTVYTYSAAWGAGSGTDSQSLSFNENTAQLSISNGNIVSLSALSGGSSGGSSGVSYLSALNDVSIPSPVNGQVLQYSNILNKWIAGSPASATGATGYYGSFYDVRAQELISTTAAKRLSVLNTYESNGITLNQDKIVFAFSGTYEIIGSIQYVNTDVAQQDIYVWYRKNGIDVPFSSSVYTIPQEKNNSIPAQMVAIRPFIVTLTAGEYVEVYWHCDTANVSVEAFTGQTNPTIPDTPSVLITVKQITNLLLPTVGLYLPLSGGSLTGAVSSNQDIEITDSTKGIILRSPSSIKYRVTVSDAGELITTQI